MDNPRVFEEYAQSDDWILAHLGQFAGYLFAFAGLVVLSQLLLGERTRATVAAYLGFAAATASLAVAAVLQAVDGIALKAMVDTWAQASGPPQAVAFGAAESVRWLEIGINSLFRLLQGATLVVVGLALVLSDRFPAGLDGSASSAASPWSCGASRSPSVGTWVSSCDPRRCPGPNHLISCDQYCSVGSVDQPGVALSR